MSLLISPTGSLTHTPLTPRERAVLMLVGQGMQHRQIATELSIAPETVRKHVKNAYKKLDAHNKIEALQKAGLWPA